MRKKIYNLMIILLLLGGCGLAFYPAISNLWNQLQQNKVADGYAEAVGGYSEEELEAMREKARQYNEDLLKDEIIVDPFDQVKAQKAGVEYYEAINPQGNGVMGLIRIPKIEVELPIYHGTGEEVLQKAIGHLEQTSLPIGGEGTHAVISGHRGLPRAELFSDLNLLEVGDEFYLEILGETLAYQVDQIKTVEPDQLEDLAIISGEDHVTLVTCTPYAINSHRLLVRGTRIPYAGETDQEVEAKEKAVKRLIFVIVVFAVVVALLILWRVRKKKQKRRGEDRKSETRKKK